MLTSSPQGLLQNQSLETILICNVVLCFPHNNIACIHMCDAAMPCKMGTRKRLEELRETVASGDTHPHKITKYSCIVEAHGSTRKSLKSTLPRNHDDHIGEKGFTIQFINLLQRSKR